MIRSNQAAAEMVGKPAASQATSARFMPQTLARANIRGVQGRRHINIWITTAAATSAATDGPIQTYTEQTDR